MPVEEEFPFEINPEIQTRVLTMLIIRLYLCSGTNPIAVYLKPALKTTEYYLSHEGFS